MINKFIVLVVFVYGTALFAGVNSESGSAIFSERGCAMCHAKDNDTVGPSIRMIGIRYSGNENKLVAYLKGQSQPIVYPERDGMMRPQLMKIGNLYEDEYRSLARYMIQAFMRTDF